MFYTILFFNKTSPKSVLMNQLKSLLSIYFSLGDGMKAEHNVMGLIPLHMLRSASNILLFFVSEILGHAGVDTHR